ncbi:uncharacterized protein EAE97_010208 [Botrytis byssoidea]|uniref:GPI2-domain-containing protein n=1 Tax=Botrytis byssoidea TaxID=139641 RepID=A0A9P5I0V7_9HELO|nr:uncharacterized protein EAE97_010208 [Botrytis byssoidea]KAF7926699.1 hypothetical protein EAE97_010208 [Botrytis byssoidea]
MVPPLAPQFAPPLNRSSTAPNIASARTIPYERSHLAPEDAISQASPPRRPSATLNQLRMTNGDAGRLRSRGRHTDRTKSSTRRRKTTWKKLLWVKQSYPDNYTDQDTFLEHLQRNPRLQPYDFWPLVADSTVIVQHVCSVIIFIVSFVGIYDKHVSPVSVVGWGSIATFLGWVLWDLWVGQEESTRPAFPPPQPFSHSVSATSSTPNLLATAVNGPKYSHSISTTSLQSTTSNITQPPPTRPVHTPHNSRLSHRTSLRLSTAKSALLIYFTLLGLSPILKSLTRSTSSDSIWAMSFLLFTINIFFFDYATPSPSSSSGYPPSNTKNKNIPASLSTNAALMASTVLASRLPSTGQVFSLTLFSIEVFGLFPVFRRYTRLHSLRGHLILTLLLVFGAGGGVGLVLPQSGRSAWDWKSGLIGVVLGTLITGLAMGGCSWWLIGLQKYKNEIHGPWDPARPVIRRAWDDY